MTLWDAGELITVAYTLGIPHPPGTPLFVLLGSAWGRLLPLGEYAWRLNLMSASFSAAGAGCLFLVFHELLGAEEPVRRLGGAAAAVLASAFTFTAWQNSNETEVYMMATFSIAAIIWLCLRWRAARGTTRAAHLLLVMVYVAALSIGNHLMTLLAGPAVAVFLWRVLRAAPPTPPALAGERRVEWSEWAVVTTLWILLIGVGLGSTALLALGGLLFAGALAFAVTARSLAFPLTALAVAAVGVSTYAFLHIRSGLDPLLDMSDPETWDRLLSVVRREQYPARGLLDDPRFSAGPGNPGRTPLLFLHQLVNYVQYFDWQWAQGLGAARAAFTAVFTALGLAGLSELRRRDRAAWSLLGTLWLVTGLGLVVYMNFKPGFSLFWDRYPGMDQHEVRERDYFFTVSFQVWGACAGVGLVALARRARRRAGVALLGVALVPFALNFTAASRRHGPDATLARDFGHNLLQSVEPYGVLFTYGDNDTYPLWFAQEVDGVRQDVTLVNLSLANLDWYLRSLRDRPTRPFDPARAPEIYRGLAPPNPPGPVLALPDSVIDGLRPVRLDRDARFRAGDLELGFPEGRTLLVRDQAMLFIIAQQFPGRSVNFAISSGRGAWLGLEPHLVQQGLAFKLVGRPDTGRGVAPGVQGIMVDRERTEYLVERVYRYGRLFEPDTLALEPAARQVATSLGVPFLELGQVYGLRRDQARALDYFRRAYRLAPSPQLQQLVAEIESRGVGHVFAPAAKLPERP